MTKINLATFSRWYVVGTNPTCEDRAAKSLSRSGFGVYFPTRRIERFNSRKGEWVTRKRSLMPGYLFVEMPDGPLNWWVLRRCDGVKKVLGDFNAERELVPASIPSRLVERVMAGQMNMEFDDTREARKKRGEQAISLYQPGVAISVTKGPFVSFPATVEAVRPNGTVEALVALFGRLTSIQLAPDQVELAA